jgi:hypothetical protein
MAVQWLTEQQHVFDNAADGQLGGVHIHVLQADAVIPAGLLSLPLWLRCGFRAQTAHCVQKKKLLRGGPLCAGEEDEEEERTDGLEGRKVQASRCTVSEDECER